MLCLYINTATKENHIALIRDNELLIENKWLSNRDETQKLLVSIEELLKTHKKSFDDLTHLFIINGPGGFTSLRVGITIANTISYLTKCKISSNTLFELRAFEIDPKIKDYIIVHSATKREIFIEGKGKYTNNYNDINTQNFNEFLNFLSNNKKTPIIGELIPEHKEQIKTTSTVLQEPDQKAFLELISKAKWKENMIIEPFYGRMGQV